MNPDDGTTGPVDRIILNAAHQKRLSYVRPSDEWMITHRCQKAAMVHQGYNGGAHIGLFCSDCKGPVLRGVR